MPADALCYDFTLILRHDAEFSPIFAAAAPPRLITMP